MGDIKGIKLAEKLKIKADAKNNQTQNMIFERILKEALEKVKQVAEGGGYEHCYYNDNLKDTFLLDKLKSSLKGLGFKVQSGVDAEYSAHVGRDMIFIKVLWK